MQDLLVGPKLAAAPTGGDIWNRGSMVTCRVGKAGGEGAGGPLAAGRGCCPAGGVCAAPLLLLPPGVG